MAQAGYNEFIELVELPNYAEKFKDKEYSTRQDPIWQSDLFKRKKHAESLVFYHVDQIGTPQVLTNDQGEKVWDIKLDTWGKALEINTSNNLLEQTNIRFQGQYYDEETGLHYNRHRYYEPHSARYVSKDPIGLDGGLNSSTYVGDPNLYIDPFGLSPNISVPGLQSDPRMSKRSPLVKGADRALNGMGANVTAALGLGITHSTSYAGGGRAVHSTGRTIGIGLAVSTTRDIVSTGNKPDGRYLEICGGVGATWFGQICGGYSWSGKSFFSSVKFGSGAGAGIGIVDGWQNTSDYNQEAPVYKIPSDKVPVVPSNLYDFSGL